MQRKNGFLSGGQFLLAHEKFSFLLRIFHPRTESVGAELHASHRKAVERAWGGEPIIPSSPKRPKRAFSLRAKGLISQARCGPYSLDLNNRGGLNRRESKLISVSSLKLHTMKPISAPLRRLMGVWARRKSETLRFASSS